MINDLGAEATTVHARFASAIVAFIVAVPEPCLGNHGRNLIAALTRLCARETTSGDLYKAEAIGLLVWHPHDGSIDATWPPQESPLRIEKFSKQVEACYTYRFAGQPPHNTDYLEGIFDDVDGKVRSRDMFAAVHVVDDLVLPGRMPQCDKSLLRQILDKLIQRRKTKSN